MSEMGKPVYSEHPSLQRAVVLGLDQLNARGLMVITGASGVGKTHLANWFHRESRFAQGAWIAQSAASLEQARFESEVFGHVKGAFTGAVQSFPGLLGMAAGGTLLIESLEDLALEGQGRWLRLLESKTYRPVGSTQEKLFSGCLIFTCQTRLKELLEKGGLREDFYYRLIGLELKMPNLSQRKEDFATVFGTMAEEVIRELGTKGFGFSQGDLEACRLRSFPGGWHQLRNLLVRAAILKVAPGSLALDDIPDPEFQLPTTGSLKSDLAELEKLLLARALQNQPDSRQQLAEQLGISLRALQYKLQRYGFLDAPQEGG